MAYIGNYPAETQTVDLKWDTGIKTASFTAEAGKGYWINTTSSAVTVTLPSSANAGDTIEFSDYTRNWGTNNVTINPNSLNFQGNSSPNPVYDVDGQSVRIVYSGATKGWIPTSDDDVTFETATLYSGDILVVAGGGSDGDADSGNSYASGGGGAGGYRSFTSETFTGGSVYTITVGAGGTSHANGSNSSISGTGINYTSAGGGAGGDSSGGGNTPDGNDGGSGGGSGANGSSAPGGSGNTPATLTSQGNNGGIGTDSGNTGAGGGGGAGAVGGNGSTGVGGNGGNGTANSITGSSVTYAGGGGGGAGYGPDGTGGTGGTGGGGNGSGTGQGTAGTANTGGGAGGSEGQTVTAINGGSGVVILRVPTASYSGTTTGSPTVSVDGTDTVIKFTGSGSYTG